MILRALILISAMTTLSACGVKGKPLPPLQPPPVGDGRNLKGQDKNESVPRKSSKWKNERDKEDADTEGSESR